MLRILGVRSPLVLLAIGAAAIGVGWWQHATLIALVGAYLVVRGAVGAARRGAA
jgi:hypothetical protein